MRRLRELFTHRSGRIRPPAAAARAPREYVGLGHGQLHLHRHGGGPRALLVLHDPPGSGRDVEPLARAVVGRAVIAPDLPGSGLSDPLEEGADCAAYAGVLAEAMTSLGFGTFDVAAFGLSVPIAVALAGAAPQRVGRLLLDGMPLLDRERATALARCYAPPIVPSREGSHFVATWHRLRDEQLQWPWYDGSQAARRRIEPDLDAGRLHHRLVATLQQPAAYGWACRAALREDLAAAMGRLPMPVTVMDGSPDPRYAGVAQLAGATPHATLVSRPPAGGDATRCIAALLGE